MVKFLKTYWASLLVVAAILVLSFMPGRGMPRVHVTNIDKLVHGLMYCGLAGVLTINLWQGKVHQIWLVSLALLIPIFLGGIIELLQPYFPPRTCEFSDWVADAIGAAIGFLSIWALWIRTHSYTK